MSDGRRSSRLAILIRISSCRVVISLAIVISSPSIVILEQMTFKALKDELLGHLLRDLIEFLSFVGRRQVVVAGLLGPIKVVISSRAIALTH